MHPFARRLSIGPRLSICRICRLVSSPGRHPVLLACDAVSGLARRAIQSVDASQSSVSTSTEARTTHVPSVGWAQAVANTRSTKRVIASPRWGLNVVIIGMLRDHSTGGCAVARGPIRSTCTGNAAPAETVRRIANTVSCSQRCGPARRLTPFPPRLHFVRKYLSETGNSREMSEDCNGKLSPQGVKRRQGPEPRPPWREGDEHPLHKEAERPLRRRERRGRPVRIFDDGEAPGDAVAPCRARRTGGSAPGRSMPT